MNKQTLLPARNSTWRYGLLLGTLLLAHAPSPAHGQLVAGDVIRIKASQSTGTGRGWSEGSVVRLAPDTLWYQSSGSVSALSWDDVELERATLRNHRWSGLAIGAAAGGAIGAFVALVNSEPTFPLEGLSLGCSLLSFACPVDFANPFTPDKSQTGETVTYVLGGALIGGGLGYVVGRLLGRWETVELDQVIVGDGSLAVSMSIRR